MRSNTEFFEAFERGTLAKEEWTHEALIRIACLYSQGNTFDEALKRLQVGLLRLTGKECDLSVIEPLFSLIYLSVKEMDRWSWKEFKLKNPALFEQPRRGLA